MFTHEEIWRTIDRLAEKKGYSASGLAKLAGLDPTAFNRSKRISPNGKPRWPSTESLSKIMQVTGCSMRDLLALMGEEASAAGVSLPMLSYQDVQNGSIITANANDSFVIAIDGGGQCFAVTVDGSEMAPLFRSGAVLVADPDAKIRADDRVLLFSKQDGLKSGVVQSVQKKTWTLLVPDRDFEAVTYAEADLAWTARILWASQ